MHRDIGAVSYVTLIKQNMIFHKQRNPINSYHFQANTFQEILVLPSIDDGKEDIFNGMN